MPKKARQKGRVAGRKAKQLNQHRVSSGPVHATNALEQMLVLLLLQIFMRQKEGGNEQRGCHSRERPRTQK